MASICSQCADRLIEETIQLVKDVAENVGGLTATNYSKSRVGGQEEAGGPEENWYRHNQPTEIDDTYLDFIINHTMDLCNAGNHRDVIPYACRTLLLDIIYDDFRVCTRTSSLPGQNRMRRARRRKLNVAKRRISRRVARASLAMPSLFRASALRTTELIKENAFDKRKHIRDP